MADSTRLETYRLSADEEGVVTWEAPDGHSYALDPRDAAEGRWLRIEDAGGRPVMAFRTKPGEEGTLVLCLEGACSLAAALLHEGDDFPRRYACATDEGNENPLERPAFILRAANVPGCPVQPWAGFRILCVG